MELPLQGKLQEDRLIWAVDQLHMEGAGKVQDYVRSKHLIDSPHHYGGVCRLRSEMGIHESQPLDLKNDSHAIE
jgi:hypothetical protein